MKPYSKQTCEFLRHQARTKFDRHRSKFCDLLQWGLPHRAWWILSMHPGERKNHHVVDPTHVLALRSFVAGFLEGNTSASRPWARVGLKDTERAENTRNKEWLQHFTNRVMINLGSSNFYHAAGSFYYDYGVVNTGAHYFEERGNDFFVHTLIPGSYYVINNAYNEAVILVRELTLNVKSIVDTYGRTDEDGKVDWSNISDRVKKMYDESNYTQMIDVVHTIKENPNYDPENPDHPMKRKWVELVYELGGTSGNFYTEGQEAGVIQEMHDDAKFLLKKTVKRKPFVVGKSTEDSEYGQRGPTLDALGLIKSLNKKAISKDMALEQILNPALQGPASLRKNYVSYTPNSYVPLDARSISAKQKVESIYQISGQGVAAIAGDVLDMRQQVDKLYYADFLLFLSKNPKTRTARETDAIVEEQQRIIGPNLQSLNFTYNTPVMEWVMDWTLFEDPYLRPPPEDLQGQSLTPEFISVFAQAQKAFDLPAIDRYVQMVANVSQIDPKILQKANLDKLADLYEDRLYLPAGLNNPQEKVDAVRQQAAREAQRQEMLQETLPQVAKAAKDASAATQQRQQ